MKVSIITVAYNSADTIADAIQSVLTQTYRNIEYWVIDGGSTDGTIDIIKQYEALSDGRLHWLSERDKGIYDAMNKGVARATGDVVGILNSDDYFTSDDVIQRMVDGFSADIDAIYCDVHFVRHDNPSRCIRYYSGRLFRPWMVRLGFIPPHPSLYVRTSLLRRFGAYDDSYKISADFELIAWLCYIHGISSRYLPLDFVTMRTGGASTRDLKARIVGTREDLIACRRLGIKTNLPLIYTKYVFKIISALLIRK